MKQTLLSIIFLSLAIVARGQKTSDIAEYDRIYNDETSMGMTRVELNAKYGFINNRGKLVTKYWYNKVKSDNVYNDWQLIYTKNKLEGIAKKRIMLNDGSIGDCYCFDTLAQVKRNGHWKLIKTSGKEILPGYDEIKYYDEGYFYATRNGSTTIFDTKLQKVVTLGKGQYFDRDHRILRVETKTDDGKKSKWSVTTLEGRVLTLNKYDHLRHFDDLGLAQVGIVGKGWGMINLQGKEVLPPKYAYISSRQEGFFIVAHKRDGKRGIVNKEGKEIAPVKYKEVGPFTNGIASVRLEENGKWAYINSEGKEITPFKYDKVYSFITEVAWVTKGKGKRKRYALVNRQGKEITPFKYTNAKSFSEGLAEANTGSNEYGENGKWSWIDVTGKAITPFEYDEVRSFKHGIAHYRKGGKTYDSDTWGLINAQGKETTPAKYRAIDDPREGVAIVSVGGGLRSYKSWKGLINSKGEEIAAPEYHDIDVLYGKGLIKVGVGSKKGLMDMRGKRLTPLKYFVINHPFEDRMVVGLKGEDARYYYGVVDKKGREVIPCIYGNIDGFDNGVSLATQPDKEATYKVVIDKEGRVIVPKKTYDYIHSFKHGFAIVSMGLKQGVINSQGKLVVPMQDAGVGIMIISKNLIAVKHRGSKKIKFISFP